ncbi:MAG: hypothetical protein JW862_07835, partial [Anaerolineales bacterium]|nr:hypothetical protein [Anaerolineales bacterium]
MDTQRFTKKVWQLVTLALLFLIWQQAAGAPAAAAPAATFTVNTNNDLADLSVGDGHCDVSVKAGDQCSLRAAIQESNSLATADVIVFDSLVMLIQPTSALPALNTDDRNPTTIYGAGVVTLDGSSAGVGVNGLVLQSYGHTIQGLVITSFDGCGLRITGNKAKVGVV